MYDLRLIGISGEIAKIEYVFNVNLISRIIGNDGIVAVDNLHNSASYGSVSEYSYLNHFSLQSIIYSEDTSL